MMERRSASLPVARKIALVAKVWRTYLRVLLLLRRHGLAATVDRLAVPATTGPMTSHPPVRLSRAVSRSLRLGAWQPRCLLRSLVLYRLAREQGDPVELVIGLTDRSSTSDAHAWVELTGRDIGPTPGQSGHRELVRYPAPAGISTEDEFDANGPTRSAAH